MPRPSQSSNDLGSSSAGAHPGIVLEPISAEQATVLHNLVELYTYDFSEHVPLELKPNGRFEAVSIDGWWTEGHYPFFIRCDGKLCGFALVRRGSRFTGATEVMDVAEFFVIRGARRRGIGATVAHRLFASFPGAWEVRVRPSNAAAQQFWSRTVEAWVGRPVASTPVSQRGVEWNVLRVDPQP